MKNIAKCLAIVLLAGCDDPTQPGSIPSPPLTGTSAIGNWTAVASMATPRYYLGTVTDASGLIYAIGGFRGPGAIAGSGGTALTSMERYNTATNTWTARASMQFPHQGGAYALGKNGKIYVFGGGSSASPQRVEAYDIGTNTWASVAPMPTPREYFGAATAADGKIFLIGGFWGGTYLNRVEAYDPATNSWFSGPAMPTSRSRLAVVATPDGKIYAIGGTDGIRALNTVEMLNPTTLTWAAVAPLPSSRMEVAAAVTPTGQIYVIGGENFGSNVSTTTDFFDPSVNGWISEPNLNTGRRLLGAATGGDGRIYAVGGANLRDTALGTVEALVPTPVVTVSVQVGTGANGNVINPNLPDTIRVYVLGSASFNVSGVVTSGAVFAGTTMLTGTTTSDINGDGRNDLRFSFVASAMSLPIGTTEACIGGGLTSGSYFKGCAKIQLSATGRVWAAIASMSTTRFGAAAVTGNDGRIYVMGGRAANGTVLATVEAYNPTTNAWTPVASMPAGRYLHAAAKGSDGRIYVFGGSNGTAALNTVAAYNVGTNTWVTRANMSAVRDAPAVAIGSNNRIHIFGGTNDNNSVWQTGQAYNTGTDTYSAVANMSQTRFEHAAVPGSNGRLYVLGGWGALADTDPRTTVESYNVTGNSWTTHASMPGERAGLGAAADGTTIYAIGGEDGQTTVNTTFGYRVASNVWYQLPGLTTRRSYLAVATGLDGRIYAIGGYDGQNYLATAEVFATQFNAGLPLVPLK